MKTRNEKIVELYSKGMVMSKIGQKWNITDARVWQIVKKHYNNIDTSKRQYKKQSLIKRLTKSEKFVCEKLKSLGIKFETTGYNEYYDLTIKNKKVEIKFRSKPIKINYKTDDSKSKGCVELYKFNFLIPRHPIDYFIFVCGQLNKETKFYIYPANILKDNLAIQTNHVYNIKPKSLKYLENWEVFK